MVCGRAVVELAACLQTTTCFGCRHAAAAVVVLTVYFLFGLNVVGVCARSLFNCDNLAKCLILLLSYSNSDFSFSFILHSFLSFGARLTF